MQPPLKESAMFYSVRYFSPVGPLTVVSDEEHVVGLWIDGQKYFQSTLTVPPVSATDRPVLMQAVSWLDRYFSGQRPSPDELPLAPAGSEFRRFIWQALCRIPWGSVVTYGELAEQAARAFHRKTMSAQAVGGAVGHNPISIIIPCHRVVGTGGSLTGYAGGIGRKIWLLEHEGADMSRLSVPKKGTAL